MAAILSTENLSFRSILRFPDLQIQSGRTSFISGESGCGKSTLLKLFNGTLSPDTGRVLYDGTDILTLDAVRLRQEVLLISQSVFLFDGTIRDNFLEYYTYKNLPVPYKEDMEQFLHLCCADYPLDTIVSTMSGGEQQRVFLAINLSFSPKVLLLDEPTSALDSHTASQLFEHLTKHSRERGMSLVTVSHDRSLMETYADEIITLAKGTHR